MFIQPLIQTQKQALLIQTPYLRNNLPKVEWRIAGLQGRRHQGMHLGCDGFGINHVLFRIGQDLFSDYLQARDAQGKPWMDPGVAGMPSVAGQSMAGGCVPGNGGAERSVHLAGGLLDDLVQEGGQVGQYGDENVEHARMQGGFDLLVVAVAMAENLKVRGRLDLSFGGDGELAIKGQAKQDASAITEINWAVEGFIRVVHGLSLKVGRAP